MSTFVPLLNRDQIHRLPERAREVVEYRKSGLSLNHVQGCLLGCAYCIRLSVGGPNGAGKSTDRDGQESRAGLLVCGRLLPLYGDRL